VKERVDVGREEDKSMPGMLRRGLAAEAGEMAGNDCPEPEILAAYFDRSLDADETARYDLHFSRCANCRQQLGAMARASDGEGEKKAASGWEWLLGTRWLAPAAIGFAVLVIVSGFMLHMRRRDLANDVAMSREPAAPPTEIVDHAAHNPETHSVANSAANSAQAAPASNESKAKPVPPLSMSAREDQLSSSANARTHTSEEMYRQGLAMASRKKQIESQQAMNAKGSAGSSAVAANSRAGGAETSARAAPSAAMVVEPEEAKPPAADAVKSQSKPSAESSRAAAGAPVASANAPGPAAGRVAPAPDTPAPPPRASFESSMKARVNDQAAQVARSRMQQAQLSSNLAGITITTPDPQVIWMVSDSDNISRSEDAGATWKSEQIETDDRFVASSAPTPKICWLVGERGTILRTTDGKTWASVQPPSNADFAGFSRVDAKDGLTATVTTMDGRKFSTTDGGRIWKLTK
jgi:hypothetical protein